MKLTLLRELELIITRHTSYDSDLRLGLPLIRYAARPKGLLAALQKRTDSICTIYDSDELCLYTNSNEISRSMSKIRIRPTTGSVAYLRFSKLIVAQHNTRECYFALTEMVRLAELARKDRSVVMYLKFGKSITPVLSSGVLKSCNARFSREVSRYVELTSSCCSYRIRIRLSEPSLVIRLTLTYNDESIFSEVLSLYLNY